MDLSEDEKSIEFDLHLSSADLYEALQLHDPRGATKAEIIAGASSLSRYVFDRVSLSVPGQECKVEPPKVGTVFDEQLFATISTQLHCPRRIETTVLSYDLLFDLDPLHEGLLRVSDDYVLLSDDSRIYTQNWRQHEVQSRLGFLRSGIDHVLSGFDHILFLISLLLVIGLRQRGTTLRARTVPESLRSAATIVTAFTAGHSLTLILAALGWIALPSQFVESMIAASIVYVAVENLFRPDPPRRYLVTLAFGLMHGLGFAAMLRPLLPPQHVVVPLLVFNVGVEIGQLMIVILALPVLLVVLRKLGVARYRRVAMPLASCAVGAMGLFWFVQRVLAL